MNKLADALVYALTYFNLWPDEAEEFLRDDVNALEAMAADLHEASEAEQDALAAAAERALAGQQAGRVSLRSWVQLTRPAHSPSVRISQGFTDTCV